MSARTLHRLSARFVATVAKPGRYCDGGGLWLNVRDRGGYVTRAWEFRWMLDNKPQSMGLGSVGDVSLAEARELAREYRKKRRDNPRKVRDEKNLQHRHQDTHTLYECVEDLLTARQGIWSEEYIHAVRKRFENHVFDVTVSGIKLRNLSITALTTDMVVGILRPIWKTKNATAVLLKQHLELLISYSRVVFGLRIEANPARWRDNLEHVFGSPSKVHRVQHRAFLPFGEAPDLFEELCCMGYRRTSVLLRFVILNPLRIMEAAQAKWPEVDWNNGRLRIPAERIKGQIPFPDDIYDVPLAPASIAILEEQYRLRVSDDGYIFTVHGGSGSGSHVRRKDGHIERNAVWHLLKGLHPGITIHGFRTTFRKWADDCTVCEWEVKEMALAHKIGDDTFLAYSRTDWFEKRAHLMNKWAEYVTGGELEKGIFIGISDNPVSQRRGIRRRAA